MKSFVIVLLNGKVCMYTCRRELSVVPKERLILWSFARWPPTKPSTRLDDH